MKAVRIVLMLTATLVFGAPASAQTHVKGVTPACDDPDMVRNVEFSYSFAEKLPTDPGILKVSDIKHIGLFPPPEKANQYASTTNYIKEARFCEGTVTMPDGTSETAYWRIYYVVNTQARDLAQAEFCSAKHDVWMNQCKVYKPDEGAKPLN